MSSGDLVVRRIGRLLTMAGDSGVGLIENGAVVIEAGRVAWVGRESDLPPGPDRPELDAAGACVTPGFVDAHTHAVWAGTRTEEFAARMRGERYDGGGIRTTVAATRAAGHDELVRLTLGRLDAMLAHGTTTVEVKTGYAHEPWAEIALLDVIAEVARRSPARVEATFLGAHAAPEGDRAAYVEAVSDHMPAAAARGARWADVFCDVGAFTLDETLRLLGAAKAAGLLTRVHAEQLARTGAAELAAQVGCASADHLDHVDERGARAMKDRGVVGVLLPTATLSTRGRSWDSVRVLREAGVTVALGTDCNPGTSWCESMPYAIQLACLLLEMSVEEAFWAATAGAATSLRRSDVGRLSIGRWGDLVVLDAAHEGDLVAHLGARPAASVVVAGDQQSGSNCSV
ncbi:MAG TPA: imidazolonepropionase [Mycobacteriales bacterium]|nr:imidazolonepropionase [Mycobacteriales bacterium]